jgi:zeta-carotene desaturase
VKRTAVIIGGGLAGIAAAVRLTETEDCRPVVVETRQRLGGRATSLRDPRSGLVIDNCQHVLMGCCSNLIDLYDRLDVLDRIEWHRELYWTRGGGEIVRMKAGLLPAPLHLAGGLRHFPWLDRVDRNVIARAMLRMVRMGYSGRLAWRNRTFRAFLDEHKQTDNAVDRFWRPIVVSACNLDIDRVAASYALQVFQEGFLANRWSYTMGVPACPLADLYEPAVSMIEEAGGEVRLGSSVRAIGYDGKRITGVTTDDGMIQAAGVISAVPFDRLDKLVTDVMRRCDQRLARLGEIEVSPILGVHLLFDQIVMDLPHLTLIDHGVQWLFNKGVDDEGYQHVHAVISAADSWMDLDEAEITRRVVADLHDVLPKSVGLEPFDVRAIKEKRATFAPTPDVDRLRPSAEPAPIGLGGGGVRNLFLAGDWCDTGWPATMEGAARSGYQAARAFSGEGGLVEEVPPGALSRTLGLR